MANEFINRSYVFFFIFASSLSLSSFTTLLMLRIFFYIFFGITFLVILSRIQYVFIYNNMPDQATASTINSKIEWTCWEYLKYSMLKIIHKFLFYFLHQTRLRLILQSILNSPFFLVIKDNVGLCIYNIGLFVHTIHILFLRDLCITYINIIIKILLHVCLY